MSPKINLLLAEQHASDLRRSVGQSGLSLPSVHRLIAAARRARV